jgi:hypothetical protein
MEQSFGDCPLQAIFNCRFFTLLGVAGSLFGSLLCFLKVSKLYVSKDLGKAHPYWQRPKPMLNMSQALTSIQGHAVLLHHIR